MTGLHLGTELGLCTRPLQQQALEKAGPGSWVGSRGPEVRGQTELMGRVRVGGWGAGPVLEEQLAWLAPLLPQGRCHPRHPSLRGRMGADSQPAGAVVSDVSLCPDPTEGHPVPTSPCS